jgi:hypothetical protein
MLIQDRIGHELGESGKRSVSRKQKLAGAESWLDLFEQLVGCGSVNFCHGYAGTGIGCSAVK